MKIRRVIAAILLPLATLLFLMAVVARIDSHEAHRLMRAWDVVIGVLLAVCFLLAGRPKIARQWIRVVVAVFIWVLVSGLLMSCHEFQVYARALAPYYGITHNRIVHAYKAITEYRMDCGDFPSETQGLDVLCKNPGLTRWKGPYWPQGEPLCDGWRHRLCYALRGNNPVIWSCGRDGINGTKDDINVDYAKSEWEWGRGRSK
jgi:hypothetical protein